MRHLWAVCICCVLAVTVSGAQETPQEFTAQELSVIEKIKSQNSSPQETTAATPAAPTAENAPDTDIKLSQQTKQEAFNSQQQLTPLSATPQAADGPAAAAPADPACLTVAFIDIDQAFNEHPRTQAVKKQIDQKIKSKQREVQNAKEVIAALQAENKLLSRQLTELTPFYERIVTDQLLLPAAAENADALAFTNLLNRLLFSGSETLSTSPLNSPAQLAEITQRISENKKIIAQRSFFIDNYKYQVREEILNLEQAEVNAILQDIYSEIKSFAQKRNIGAIVRKEEILYGQAPVNVTKDFVTRLKKSKKYHKK